MSRDAHNLTTTSRILLVIATLAALFGSFWTGRATAPQGMNERGSIRYHCTDRPYCPVEPLAFFTVREECSISISNINFDMSDLPLWDLADPAPTAPAVPSFDMRARPKNDLLTAKQAFHFPDHEPW